MAPSPEPQGTEPKAPDKTASNTENNRKDINSNPETTDCNNTEDIDLISTTENEESSDVSDFNEGQLKALLDEAYNYKGPRDREGKSEIFKKYLEEAETAESQGGAEKGLLFAEAPVGGRSSKRRSGRREAGRAVSEGQSRCGSLQNLSQCHVEPWQLLHSHPSSRRSRHGPNQFRRGASTSSTCSSATSESVSTRQREGGSLPCSVNAVHDLLATAGCVGDDAHCDVPSLQDLTIWHSNYNYRGNSMPKLPSSPPSEGPPATPPPQQEAEVIATVKTRSSTSPGFHKEVTTEFIARVEAVKSEKQQIREAAEKKELDDYNSCQPQNYCSSYSVQLAPTRQPSQVDETAEIINLTSKTQYTDVMSPIVSQFQMADCNAVSSVIGNSKIMDKSKPNNTRDMSNENTSLSKPIYYSQNYPKEDTAYMSAFSSGASKTILPSATKLDENGNSLREEQTSSRTSKKKQKDKQKSKLSQDCPGFRGNMNLSELLDYIEGEPAESSGTTGGKQMRQKRSTREAVKQDSLGSGRRSQRLSEESNESGKQRGAKAKNGKSKKRSNSLEEVSRTKLEDLTAPPESSRSVGDGRTSQASNWGDDLDDDLEDAESQIDVHNGNSNQFYSEESSGFKEDFYSVVEASPQHNEDREEFRVVTKKQRRKKQRSRQVDHHSSRPKRVADFDEDDDSSLILGYSRPYQQRKHTSSMPPSDQSGESSDMDSVYSLPISSSKHNVSGSTTPQASYADIAKTHADIPNNINSNNNNNNNNNKVLIKSTSRNKSECDEWPQVRANKTNDKKDVSNYIEANNVSSISPASSTISSSAVTEPNSPPSEAIVHDFPPLVIDKNKASAVVIKKVDSSAVTMVNGIDHDPIDKTLKITSLTRNKPPAFVSPPSSSSSSHQQQIQQQQFSSSSVTETQQQPAVILLNEGQRSDSNSDVSGLTFGFEINEQLLQAEDNTGLVQEHETPTTTPTRKTKDFAAMFRPPTEMPPVYNANQIVDYVYSEWNKVKRELENGGIVEIYSVV